MMTLAPETVRQLPRQARLQRRQARGGRLRVWLVGCSQDLEDHANAGRLEHGVQCACDRGGVLIEVRTHRLPASAQGRVDVGAAAQVDTPGVLGDDEQATVEVNDADHYVVEVAGLAADDVQHDQRLSSTECSGDRRIRRTRGLTMLISGCGGTLKLTAVPIPTCFNGGPSGRTLRLPERIG